MNSPTLEPVKDAIMYRALDLHDNSIVIAEGDDAQEVLRRAEQSGKEYIFVFIPEPNTTYIY